MLCTAPLAAFPARQAVDYVACGSGNERWPQLRFYGMNAALYVVSYVLAVLLPRELSLWFACFSVQWVPPEITVVFNFTGAVGSATTAFIFPALCLLKVTGPSPITRRNVLTLQASVVRLPVLADKACRCWCRCWWPRWGACPWCWALWCTFWRFCALRGFCVPPQPPGPPVGATH